MKKIWASDILALSFISAIGLFELFYRHNLTDGYLALGMAFILVILHIVQKPGN